MSLTLHAVVQLVSGYMEKIQREFKPGSKIAVMVRAPGFPDRDFMLTDDTVPELRAMLDRREAPADPPIDLVTATARLTARAKDMTRLRDVFINIRDDLDDEGDRVYFGSTNDADQFRAIVDELDAWVWDEIIEDGKRPDYLGDLRSLRVENAKLRTALERIESGEIAGGPDPDDTRALSLHLKDTVQIMKDIARAALGATHDQ